VVPIRVHTILISTQHNPDVTNEQIRKVLVGPEGHGMGLARQARFSPGLQQMHRAGTYKCWHMAERLVSIAAAAARRGGLTGQ
jgi:hypothetical protein